MSTSPNSTKKEKDGGYYAIKGFLFQFDLTMIKILNNPQKKIQFEQIQDINYENYVIQVKHKETQNYSDSKIRKPIIQLIEIFSNDSSKKLNLYCHFKDQAPNIRVLKLAELDKILGNEKSKFKRPLKLQFIKNFHLVFSHDYNSQFLELIELIKQVYTNNNDSLAIYYHSIFRSRLLELAIKNKGMRELNKSDLDEYLKDVRKVFFHSTYTEFLSKEQYEKIIKKEFFTIKTPNLNNFERLFLIDVNKNDHIVDIQKTINNIIKKYFRPNKSPAPIICFHNIPLTDLNLIKQALIDQGVFFNDGTFFNGDRFRIDRFLEKSKDKPLKLLTSENLSEVTSKLSINEIYQFYTNNLLPIQTTSSTKYIQIYTKDIEQITKIVS